MPRKGNKRMGKYLRGTVDEVASLTTLGAETLVGNPFDSVVDSRTRVTSIVATYALADFTPTAGVGPIVVGIAHGDYSDAEIEAWIEQTGSWNESDLVSSKEVANRLIRMVGTFDRIGNAEDVAVLNDGKPIKTRLNWLLNEGATLKQWAYNSGTGAVATTVPQFRMNGHVNLFVQ